MAEDDPGFLGRGWAFPPAFDSTTGAASMVAAEDDIVQSLMILFLTRPGERVMHPTYGCRLHDLVFEPMTGATRRAVEDTIRRAILFFEPRIDVEAVDARVLDPLGGRLEIDLGYRVRTTNARHNMVFPFYISEGSLLGGTPLPKA